MSRLKKKGHDPGSEADLVHSRMHRGRDARRPRDIPWAGWKDILKRTYEEVGNDSLSVIAAGVAFYAMLAIFPLLGAAVATYGLLADRAVAADHIARLYEYMPPSAASLISERVHSLVETDGKTLGAGLLLSLGFALFSGSRGMDALFDGVHIAYDESRARTWWKQRLLAFALTVAAVAGGIISFFLVAAMPSVFEYLRFGGAGRLLAEVIRFCALTFGIVFGLAALYRYGPKRKRAKWRWLFPGAVTGAALWLLGSYGFSFYASRWGSYDESYGAIGGVIVLMLWLWISAFAVLLGAEFNAEVEAQTAVDTTVSGEQPLGERNAVKADVIGRVQQSKK